MSQTRVRLNNLSTQKVTGRSLRLSRLSRKRFPFPSAAVTAAAVYIEDVFNTYLYTGNGSTVTITNDTTTNATYYPVAVNATTGTLATIYTANPDLTFNPSTGIYTYGTGTFVQLNSYRESSASPSITANTLTIDLSTGTVFTVALNSNINTFTITNIASGTNVSLVTLVFIADGSVRTVTWPVAFKWPSGTAPTLTTTNGQRDVFTFFTSDGGTTWLAFTSGQNL